MGNALFEPILQCFAGEVVYSERMISQCYTGVMELLKSLLLLVPRRVLSER